MVPFFRAIAVPEITTSGRISCNNVPSELAYQYSVTSSR